MGTHQRTLIHIPILHTQTDMGALRDSVQRAMLQRLGVKAWRHKMRMIDEMWAEIGRVVGTMPLDYGSVRLYQDGLPVCGREEQIVRELADRGSSNHRLLLSLMEKGAILMGTESPEMLLEEYEQVRRSSEGYGSGRVTRPEKETGDSVETLLQRRNKFIAHQINTTLQPGETGILFLGMLHTLDQLLDHDIEVVFPISRPLQSGGKGNG